MISRVIVAMLLVFCVCDPSWAVCASCRAGGGGIVRWERSVSRSVERRGLLARRGERLRIFERRREASCGQSTNEAACGQSATQSDVRWQVRDVTTMLRSRHDWRVHEFVRVGAPPVAVAMQ